MITLKKMIQEEYLDYKEFSIAEYAKGLMEEKPCMKNCRLQRKRDKENGSKMKKHLITILMMLVLAGVMLVGCGGDDGDASDDAGITQEAEEPTQSETAATPSATESAASPTPTAEPTPVEENRRPQVSGGSVFIDCKGKGLAKMINNILDMRTISTSTTMDNFADRFDTAPNPLSLGILGGRATYTWLPEDCGSDEFISSVEVTATVTDGLIDISSETVGEDFETIEIPEGGGCIYITITLKNRELAKGLYDRIGEILRQDYEEIYRIPDDQRPVTPVNEENSEGDWSIVYGNARHATLQWNQEQQAYTLNIDISLRYAKP